LAHPTEYHRGGMAAMRTRSLCCFVRTNKLSGTQHPTESHPAMLQEARTDDPLLPARLAADAGRVFSALEAGEVAIVPLDVAYAIIGMKTKAIAAIFAAKQRSFEKPSGMFGNLDLSDELHL